MKGWTVKKIILRCFFKFGLFCLYVKFQVSQSSPSGFLSKNTIFFHHICQKIFVQKNIYGFTPVKKRIIRIGPKMSKSKAINLKYFFNSQLLSIAAQCSDVDETLICIRQSETKGGKSGDQGRQIARPASGKGKHPKNNNGYLTVRLTVRGGGGSPPLA